MPKKKTKKNEWMNIMNKSAIFVVIGLMTSVLAGCGGKEAPDEFMVLKNAPLSIPPDFHLTPDGPYSDLDEVLAPQDIARRALFGEN